MARPKGSRNKKARSATAGKKRRVNGNLQNINPETNVEPLASTGRRRQRLSCEGGGQLHMINVGSFHVDQNADEHGHSLSSPMTQRLSPLRIPSDDDSLRGIKSNGAGSQSDGGNSSPPHVPSPPLEILQNVGPGAMSYIRDIQRTANESHITVKHLKRALADATNRQLEESDDDVDTPAKKRKTADEGVDSVKMAARQLTTMNFPWFYELNGTLTAKIRYDPEIVPGERFDDRSNRAQAQVHDILSLLPDNLREEVITNRKIPKWMFQIIRNVMGNQRSNMAHRVRKEAFRKIFDGYQEFRALSDHDLESSNFRAQNETLKRLIGLQPNADGSSYDAYNVEILHSEYDGRLDLDKIFLNTTLIYLGASLIHGKASITKLMAGMPPHVNAETNAHKWALEGVTPGLIALSAVMSRWALSADVNFTETGSETGVNWSGDFHEYHKYLSIGIHKRKRSVLNIFRTWNEALFPSFHTGPGPRTTNRMGGANNASKRALDALDQDDEEREDENKEGGEEEEDDTNTDDSAQAAGDGD